MNKFILMLNKFNMLDLKRNRNRYLGEYINVFKS